MANGSWGTIRVADVQVTDMDVMYTYVQDRSTITTNLQATAIDATTILSPVLHPVRTTDVLGGMYNLVLPANTFSGTGIYNIIIRPKEILCTVTDCGVLSARPDIRGLVLDTSSVALSAFSSKLGNGGLNGYRIEYFDQTTNLKIPNLFRLITSANRCEPITENLTNTNQKSIRYRFNDTGTLLYLTLTPSATSNIKPTATPFIGNVGQTIAIYNTFFDPISIEVEMVENTIDTIADGIFGNQTESSNGDLTLYDKNNNITKQYSLFDILDNYGNPLFKVKQLKTVIDETLGFDNIISQINNIDAEIALKTISEFNASVDDAVVFDPSVKDGKGARGLTPPRTNWAQCLDTPPFRAYPVTGGITFTYGGIEINADGAVVNRDGAIIPRLFACGEIVGGVFFNGYPSGAGLTSGTVFGRIAGYSAANSSRQAHEMMSF